ncbi:MAG: S26 family signal peptidase [Planctomycetota bacterium]
MRTLLQRVAWALAGLVLALVVARSFLGDVYRVVSVSMQPTIFGGDEVYTDEHVLVRFGGIGAPGASNALERFDLVVFRRSPEHAPMVKRVGALPNESIGVSAGDLIVNGERLGPDAPRPAPIPVFDDAFLDVRDFFFFDDDPDGPWSSSDGAWFVDVCDRRPGSDAGMMLFHKPLRDDYLSPDHRRIVGRFEVNDAILRCEVRLEDYGGALRFRLVEEGDTFEARVESEPDGKAYATILRYSSASLREPENPRKRIEVVARQELDFPLDAWHAVSFRNVDNHLSFELPGLGVELAVSYQGNEPHAGLTDVGRRSAGYRVAFGGDACRAGFRAVQVLRDLYYTSAREHGPDSPLCQYGVEEVLRLGPDEYFLLGDNSGRSNDSRVIGPVKSERLLGRPVAVVRPLARLRWLRGALGPDEDR